MKWMAFANGFLLVMALFFITSDNSIPFWDPKVHAQKSLELLSSLKNLDFKTTLNLLASDRSSGIALLLTPLFLLFPTSLNSPQLFTLLVGRLVSCFH